SAKPTTRARARARLPRSRRCSNVCGPTATSSRRCPSSWSHSVRPSPPKRGGSRVAEYNHVNLLEVEDQAPNLGLDPEQFNIRFARTALGCEDCGVSYLRFEPA